MIDLLRTEVDAATRRRMIGGAALFLAAIGWTIVSALVSGGSPLPPAALLAACAATVAGAIALESRWPASVPCVAVAVAAVLAVAGGSGTFSSQPLAGPFGYANARGSFFALAAAAAIMLVVSGRPGFRASGAVAAVWFALVPIQSRSWVAAALLALPVIALLADRPSLVRASIVGFGMLLAVAIAGSLVVGAAAGPDEGGSIGTRTALWHDALTITADHPVFGVGPGGFAKASPIARHDPDADWAHNEFLQSAAELGIPGAAAILAVFGWALSSLARRPVPDRVTAVAAAAVAMTGVHAVVDYVLHEPAVGLMAAALAGAGLAAGADPIRREHVWHRS